MIRTLIFDFGDIFINLDKKGALSHALELFQLENLDEELLEKNACYEKGAISTSEFLAFYKRRFPHIGDERLKLAWNCIIKDFPEYRLSFLKTVRQNMDKRFILLSNTNDMHINYVQETVSFYKEFRNQFDRFYLSHEIGMRKPETNIYEWVLSQDDLHPKECLFIDDTPENTFAAETLGINTWNLDPENEDITELTQRFDL